MDNSWPFESLVAEKYGVIYVDSPWKYKGHTAKGSGVPQRAKKQHYKTLTLAELMEFPVSELALPDCALLMWVTSAHTPQCFSLADHWGFKFSSKVFCWAKLNKFHGKDAPDKRKLLPIKDNAHWKIGMGRGSRRNTEDCWLFRRGRPKRMDAGVRELIVDQVGGHSEKPHEAYERIERLFKGPYCELFARNTREGWDGWGNEI